MRYARFEYKGIIHEGAVEEDFIVPINDGPFQKFMPLEKSVSVNEVKLLSPVVPSKIIAVGLNYSDHAEEFKTRLPEEPIIFLKPPSAVIGHRDDICIPAQSQRIDYEAELAVIIKKRGRDIARRDLKNYIFGYTCLNDVTARDLQKKDGQWTRAKSFDTFCPIGPYAVTNIDPSLIKIESFLNGQKKQSSDTSKMVFSCEMLVEFISRIMTLETGDVIATGTPGGIGTMTAGDEIEIRIEKIGSLINRVTMR